MHRILFKTHSVDVSKFKLETCLKTVTVSLNIINLRPETSHQIHIESEVSNHKLESRAWSPISIFTHFTQSLTNNILRALIILRERNKPLLCWHIRSQIFTLSYNLYIRAQTKPFWFSFFSRSCGMSVFKQIPLQ